MAVGYAGIAASIAMSSTCCTTSKFAEGDVGRPGRPGLLWLLLTPLMSLGSPATILECSLGLRFGCGG